MDDREDLVYLILDLIDEAYDEVKPIKLDVEADFGVIEIRVKILKQKPAHEWMH